MSAISVNLKLFYQRKIMWVFYVFLIFAAVVIPFVLSDGRPIEIGRGLFLLPMALMYGIGVLVNIIVMDTWGKPMAYCLPGHQKVMFLILCGIGAVCGALSLMILIRYPASAALDVVRFGVVLLSLNVMAYWLGLISVGSGKGTWLGLIPWILILSYARGGHLALERFMFHPLGVVLLSAASWIVTGRVMKGLRLRQAVREVCQMDMLRCNAWHTEKVRDRGYRLADILNEWFCEQMIRQRGGVRCYVWAAWYKTVGRLIVGWKTFLPLSVILVSWVGYMASYAQLQFIVVISFVPSMIGFSVLNVETLVTTEGRGQRFWAAVIGVLSMQVCMAVGLSGIVLLSYALEWFLPEVTLHGRSYTFHALQWRIMMYSIGMMPALIPLGLLCRRHIAWFVTMCIAVVLLMVVPLMQPHWPADSRGFVSGFDVVGGLLSYGMLFVCSYWRCFKQDLV